MAARVSDMFCNFYLLKNHKIGKNSTTTKAREKISTYLESVESYQFFDTRFTKFKNDQLLIIKLATDFYWQPDQNSFSNWE